MIAQYEDEVICDFAQFYHIYDYLQFGVKKAAILAYGLPKESRVMSKLNNRDYTLEEYYLVALIDEIRNFEHSYISAHSKTKPAKPKRITDSMMNKGTTESDVRSYDSAEDFEAELRKIKGE